MSAKRLSVHFAAPVSYLCVLIVLTVIVVVLLRADWPLAAAVSACLALSAAALHVVHRLRGNTASA